MLVSIALALHILSVVVWVGGMFFAYQVLRPIAASVLEPPQRLTLWRGVFSRFFPWVWACVVLVFLTGMLMLGKLGAHAPLYVHIMLGLGLVMMLIFAHVFFAPYKRLCRSVEAQQWPEGAKALNQIRMMVGINTVIGIAVILIATVGRAF